MPSLSASLMTRESIHWLVVPLAAVSTAVRDTEANASFRATAFRCPSMSSGRCVSLTQYSITTSGLEAHSSSILLASTSSFCISSSSGQRSCETYLRDSLWGLRVCRACHQASIGILPGILQTLFCCLVGNILLLSPSFIGTLPQPNRGDLLYFGLGQITSALSSILGRSKLSML